MTFSDELTPDELLDAEAEAAESQYPEAFGITFTPQVSGIALGLVGVVVAGFLWLNFVQEARERQNSLETQRDQLEAQIEQQPALEGRVQEIEREIQFTRSQQNEVLNLLSREESLDTLLFDLDQTVEQINRETVVSEINTDQTLDEEDRGEFQLTSFQPQMATPQVVNDGSFGQPVNGRIRRKTYNLEMVGTFTQIQSLISELERLQPLLLINNFSTNVTGEQEGIVVLEGDRLVFEVSQEPELTSSFQLEAILPLSPEALRATEQQAAEPTETEGNGNN